MTSLRLATRLVAAYVILSALTVVAIVILTVADPALVNPQAQVRGIIVAATSFLTLAFARRAARGQARALLRLRIVVAIVLVAIVAVLLFVQLPAWMVVEQAACGILLAAVAAIVFRPAVGSSVVGSSTPAGSRTELG